MPSFKMVASLKLMRVENLQIQNSCEVFCVSSHQNQAVREGSCGNDGIGKFDSVVLSDSNGFNNNGFFQAEYSRIIDKIL